MACLFVGPRLGRFDANGNPTAMPGHDSRLVVLGTCLLWFGWYGFNPGSQLIINTSSQAGYATSAATVGRAAVTTTLSGAAACLSCLLTSYVRSIWNKGEVRSCHAA